MKTSESVNELYDIRCILLGISNNYEYLITNTNLAGEKCYRDVWFLMFKIYTDFFEA